jgi:hypothetical protein
MEWNPAGVELILALVLSIGIGLALGITWLWVAGLVLMFIHAFYSAFS